MTKDQLRQELCDKYGMGIVLENAMRLFVAPHVYLTPTFTVMTPRIQHYVLARPKSPAGKAVVIFQKGDDRNMLARWMDFNLVKP